MRIKTSCLLVSCALTLLSLAQIALGQDSLIPEPDSIINSAQRLAVEQIAALVSAGKSEEALNQLQRLSDTPDGLVQLGPVQAASTQRIQVYQPLDHWIREQLRGLLEDNPSMRASYYSQTNSLADVAYRAFQKSKDMHAGRRALSDYHATQHGLAIVRLLVDLSIEHELCLSAMQILDSNCPQLTAVGLSLINPESPMVAQPWHRVWQFPEENSLTAERILQTWTQQTKARIALSIDVLTRQLVASALEPELLDYAAIARWASVVAKHLDDPTQRERLENTIETVLSWQDQPSTIDDVKFNSIKDLPLWSVQLNRYSNADDLTPATKPAVGRLHSAVPYHPAIYEEKVFVHELTRIRAFELASGETWPDEQSDGDLFDSQTAPEAYLPSGSPMLGSPRGELSIHEGCLYARMGSPVSAWATRSRSTDGSSQSYLIGLDLDRQGRLLRGFPLHLDTNEFEGAEFEGCPAVSGQLLIAAIVQRDQTNVRRSLAAFDRFSGQLVWRSKVLGSGAVVGSQRCNLIASTRPVVAGGLVYYCSDLGSVACLDEMTGQTIWLACYSRSSHAPSDYPRPNRFRYRSGNPCLVHKGLVYCLPQDCPELFGLDALTGNVVWATDDVDVADCSYLVGAYDQSLLASGDRLVWLDRTNGRLRGRFPELPTPGVDNSLPQPRGLGQAALVGDKAYWPTSGEILVFAADQTGGSQSVDSPQMVDRLQTQARGFEGGNLVASGPWLLMATPGRLLCVRAHEPPPSSNR